MKRRMFFVQIVLVAAITVILTVPGALAQGAPRANIPFGFTANHQVLPAGCYKVKILSDALLSLVNCETAKAVVVMVHSGDAYPAVRHGSLVFHVTAHGYRLIHVRFAGINVQSDLSVQPRAEREFAWSNAGNTTEIAMK